MKYKDQYLNPSLSLTRLINEYSKHGSLVVGFDFDGTVYDFHKTGAHHEQVKQLLRDLKSINCKLICWTAQKDLPFVEQFLKDENIPFDGSYIDAIGLFHTSTKDQFLKIHTKPTGVNLSIEDGIDLKKPEKGVLLLRKDQNQGCLALRHESLASMQGDAAFWKSAFLQASPIVNSYHNTNETLGMCKLFISKELNEHFDTNKADQIDMLQRSMDYFKTHDQFQLEEFNKEVLYHPEVIESFTQYKQQYEVAKQVNIEEEFAINPAAIQKQQRHFKSILKLDKNFHVYVHGRRDLIEKGYDEMTGKHYYKLFFDQEQ
jgi:hypothetical protein